MADTVGGAAYLEVTTISDFTKMWDSRGTGATEHVSFYRPNMSEVSGYYFLGDLARPYQDGPVAATMYVVRVGYEEAGTPLLAKPTGWERVWTSKNSGAKHPGSIWAPTPPNGYVACGHVIQKGYDEPNASNFLYYDRFACVLDDMCTRVNAGPAIWNDRKSGANQKVTVFQVAEINDFISFRGHIEAYVDKVFVPTTL